jgi:hypothetical protein
MGPGAPSKFGSIAGTISGMSRTMRKRLLVRALRTRKGMSERANSLRGAIFLRIDLLARRLSLTLSRIAFIGVLLLPFFQPNTFYIGRVGHLSSQKGAELHERSDQNVARLTPEDSAPAATDQEPATKAGDAPGPDVPSVKETTPSLSSLPPQSVVPDKLLPPGKQAAPAWTTEEVATAKRECTALLEKVVNVSEELPPAREGICGAPAPRELKSLGVNKVRVEPPATLDCKMIAGLDRWLSDSLQPAAQKNFGSSVVRIIGGSYSCRNRYGLARAPISEHALMNAIDVSAFGLANGKIIRVSRDWGALAQNIKREQPHDDASDPSTASSIQLAAAKLGARDLAKKGDKKDDPKAKGKVEEPKTKSPEAIKAEQEKHAAADFLHQAHDGACDVFGTVLGPEANEAHHDHLHLDMKERKSHRALCQ